MANPLRYWGAAILLSFLLVCLPIVYAQEEVQLRLVGIDTTAFPNVRITLLTADSRSAPVDLTNLSLQENGAPITDLTFRQVPSGVDVTFVLDANAGFAEVDDNSGLTRREKTLDTVRRFAQEYMSPDGLDTVSIVVPDEEGQSGRFLIRESSTVADVEQAIDTYDPPRLGPTPLNAMVAAALEETQSRKENDRYQAILLVTDGRRLDQQLSFPQLVAQANDVNVPIYSAILGESADEHEIANVSRLSDPTRAFYVHMAEPDAADPIYQIWQDQSYPVQVEYRSNQRQSGRNQLTLNLGPALVSSSFDLVLTAPEVVLMLADAQILRAGTAPDTPLDALQPALQPVTLAIEWPDRLPRQISEVSLLENGQPIQISGEWPDAMQGQIRFNWDISHLEEGALELAAEITDELGYKGVTEPVVVNITVERPLLPAPVPTVEIRESAPQVSETSWLRWELLAGAALALFFLLIILLWRRRKRATSEALAENDLGKTVVTENKGSDDIVMIATLEPLEDGEEETYPIEGSNVAIGSEAQKVQIFLNDGSVNRLHARIRKENQEYWLFDEGSFEGTHLNYERLVLAPHKLSDGDIVQFGKVKFQFCLNQLINLEI
jgi:hypothetical protein